jgi:hypothetical protein
MDIFDVNETQGIVPVENRPFAKIVKCIASPNLYDSPLNSSLNLTALTLLRDQGRAKLFSLKGGGRSSPNFLLFV